MMRPGIHGGTSDDSLAARTRWPTGIITIPMETRLALREQANREGRTMSALVNDAVLAYLCWREGEDNG